MQISFAQERTVSGTVSDETGFPIPGVSVLVKGTTTSTTTDFDGKFSISATPQQTLVFSYIGMGAKEVSAAQTTVTVSLASTATELEGVVVTSLGIKREKRALGYATTTVSNQQLTQVVNTNPLESLSGKIAGVDISAPATPGASPKVVVRGFSSITQSNGPLYVVDGTPLNNSFTGSTSSTRSYDGGSGINDIDPNNIESMTFLKGAAASALYGSRASNGVVIITTKRGKQGQKINIDFTSTMEFNQVARIAHTQNEFGQGWNGQGYSSLSSGLGPSNENGSWGPAFNGEVRPWGTIYNNSQQIKPYVALEDNVRDFYDTGYLRTNSINLNGGTDMADFSLSFSDLNSDGVVPTDADKYLKRTLSFNGGIHGKKFGVRTSITYTNKDQNVVNTGQGDDAGQGSTLQQDLMQIPRDISIVDLSDYKNNPFNTPSYYFTPYATNPYFAINENSTNVKGNNLLGNVNLNYKITDELTAAWQLGGNYRNESIKSYGAIVNYLSGSPQDLAAANPVVGGVTESRVERSEFDTFFNLNYLKDLSEKWKLDATVGLEYNKRESNSFAASITALDVANFYEITNSANRPTVTQSNTFRRTMGYFGQAEISYENKYFLTISGRNDTSSTLAVGNNSYFYPAASVSAVVIDSNTSFLKLRAGYSQVASDTDPYATQSALIPGAAGANFGQVLSPLGGVNYYELGTLGNAGLKPEMTNEAEVGVEANFFSGRITVDASVYNSKTKDLITGVPLDPSTGYQIRYDNIGTVENKGIELALGLTPIKTPDFSWTLNYTFTKNKNELTELNSETRITINSAYGITYAAEEGRPLGAFFARVPQKNDAGQYIVNPDTGYYVPTDDVEYIGNSQRDFVMGLQNTFKYKNFALAFAFDWKQGGEMYSYTKRLNHFVGNGIETTYNDRAPFIIPNSVIENSDGTYSENTTPISFENITNYWGNTSNNPGIEQGHIIDKTFVRLRDMSFYYTFPTALTDRMGITRLQLGLYGKNLFLWTPGDNPYVDPETGTYGNDLFSEFGEFGSNPSQRAYGATLKLSF
ncbi:SusC/RagA family TonB-linked outer membrane protein [Flavobacterium sp. RHBU_24]|uniref:SusC/RagA family TonB-linked outer membrane protein n=1 Tax=Flavobacterium sp. RHBU_24 TaxID=3391185 RepID=UPI0039850896